MRYQFLDDWKIIREMDHPSRWVSFARRHAYRWLRPLTWVQRRQNARWDAAWRRGETWNPFEVEQYADWNDRRIIGP